MNNYKHIFFDLDHTIWDFDSNSKETLNEIYVELKLKDYGIPSAEKFIEKYIFRNEYLWGEYRKGIISVEELRINRFITALADFNISNKKMAYDISEYYMNICPNKSILLPHATDTLQYLANKYTLHIITNGFHETQIRKITNSAIGHFFDLIVTSDKAGFLKPSKEIFNYSLNAANTCCEESIYIGDHLEVDILGARNAGMDQIYFNRKKMPHNEKITFEINCLSEINGIL